MRVCSWRHVHTHHHHHNSVLISFSLGIHLDVYHTPISRHKLIHPPHLHPPLPPSSSSHLSPSSPRITAIMDAVEIWDSICTAVTLCLFVCLAIYLLPNLLLSILPPQNLRKKYGSWALVTGASSGIGKAIAHRLASQSINVVLVALDDSHLTETHAQLESAYPDLLFRKVGVDLSKNPETYMAAIKRHTDDLRVYIVINNAGFLKMSFFDQLPLSTHAANIECNAVAAVRITHHFYNRMIRQRIRGCIAFTSSAVYYLPSPFAVMYGATKAFLSTFASSLAIEAQAHSVHVTVIHPSYTNSNLYAGAPNVGALSVLEKFAWSPDDVARALFVSIGRVVVRDIGAYALLTNLVGRLVDTSFLASAMIPFRDSMAPKGYSAKKRG